MEHRPLPNETFDDCEADAELPVPESHTSSGRALFGSFLKDYTCGPEASKHDSGALTRPNSLFTQPWADEEHDQLP